MIDMTSVLVVAILFLSLVPVIMTTVMLTADVVIWLIGKYADYCEYIIAKLYRS